MVGRIIEVTFILVATYLVLSKADQFGTAAQAVGSVYTQSVKTLQGNG